MLINDNQAISKPGFSIKSNTHSGWISLNPNDSDDFHWFRTLTDDLFSKLQAKEKVKQLKQYSRDLIFVGINHTSTSSWAFPSIFRDLGNRGIHFRAEIQEIKEY